MRPAVPLCSLILSTALVQFLSFHRAHASENPTEALNLFLRAAESSPKQQLSENDCESLKTLISSSKILDQRYKVQASDYHRLLCRHQNESPRNREDDPLGQTQGSADPAHLIWDGTALCQTADERLLHCEHKPESGRGLFVYAGRSSLENSPSLVCVHYEASYRSPFELEQQVAARCVVSEFDWRYEASRSDVLGIKNWLQADVAHHPLEIPAALKEQCVSVFQDAIYCTPTFIVFPETDPTRVGICHLKTVDRVFGLGALLRIGSWNSRWECESKSLQVPDRDERLSVEERSCVPDHLGRQQTPFCRFPYLPVARRPVRTYIDIR